MLTHLIPSAVLRRLVAGLAICAVLLSSLAPDISRLLSPAKLFEVCTAQGIRYLLAADDHADPSPSKSPRQTPADCPFCLPGHALAGLPVLTGSIAYPTLLLSFSLPERRLPTPRLLFAWVAPQSRAPPARVG